MGRPVLQVKDLRVSFDTRDGSVKAVNGVSFDLEENQTLGIVGESGSGKSVSALTIMGLIPMPPGHIENGEVIFRGRNLLQLTESEKRKIRGNSIAMIFQDPLTSLNPVYRIGRQIAEPLMLHKKMGKKKALDRSVELLRLAGIPHPEMRVRDYPHQLSGGMRQRVMIAMALSCDPAVLIADEPTTALDVTIQAQITDLMRDVQKRRGSSIVMITHDMGLIAGMADNILVMYAGQPVEFGVAEAVFARPFHPYTRGLLESLPRSDITGKIPLKPIGGIPPSPANLPPGCPFHPRCPFFKDICGRENPVFCDVENGHGSACHFSPEVFGW
ncbi:MAG: ABC transporter ATP-binding protein [Treponema sp.]|jgi:oligopeptide transport system ATP-binding protein|nr:ABC transporter ATP-binding protein [Treponema sp.]